MKLIRYTPFFLDKIIEIEGLKSFRSLCTPHFLLFLILVIFISSCQSEDKTLTEEEHFPPTETLYQSLSTEQTGINFINQLTDTEAFNIVEYLYYYNGGGVAIGDINNDNLPDIYLTANQLPNQLYLNQGELKFKNITATAGVAGTGDWKTGVTMADVNADGWLDIYVCQVGQYKTVEGRNQLFINNQDNTFTERAAEYGLDFQGFSTQATFFDYDGDEDLDMFLLNHSVHSAENYGKVEMREVRDEFTGDRLYRNEGTYFRDVTETTGLYSTQISYGLDVTVSDIDNNGCPDLYISNDFHENDYLYYNNCDGTFREGINTSMGHTSTFSMGNDIADLNNDLRPDIMSLDMKPMDEVVLKSSAGADPFNIYQYKLKFGYHYQYPRNALQWNQGNLLGEDIQFSEVGQLAGVAATDWSWSVLLHDMDNDGWKDAFISNGIWQRPNDLDYQKFISNQERQKSATNLELAQPMPSGQVENFAYRNTTNSTLPIFTDQSQAWGLNLKGCSNGAAYGDLDNDGDLDLVVNNLNAPLSIYENKSTDKNSNKWLKIKLIGVGKNVFGVGAKVIVKNGKQEQLQELYPNRGFQSSVDYALHFGLGETEIVEELIVTWTNGKQQILKDITANQTLVLEEKNAKKATKEILETLPVFSKIVNNLGINFTHQEDRFNDFDREKLLLHQLSTAGAKISLGDINGDGLEDVHIGGARQQAGVIYIQNKQGRFTKKESNTLRLDAHHEDVEASFFDADGDQDLDLYVVSGGGQWTGDAAVLMDRLYLNDGQGNLTRTEDALPKIYVNGAFVLTEDFNGDSFTDLLIGSRSINGKYGLSPKSYLLLNDGQGKFGGLEEDTKEKDIQSLMPEFENLGMLTDAVILEKNGEGVQQFAVVGEWLPITIFTKKEGVFIKKELPNTAGWWNTISATDLDKDGDLDLLVGNEGLNSDLKVAENQSVELYVKDFDKNGTLDPIISYYKQGKKYSFASKDELTMQMVSLRKRYNNYDSFAKSTFHDIFPVNLLSDAIHRKVETFESVVVENLGNENFKVKALPKAMQIAPIQAFAILKGNTNKILAGGNFYGNQPSLGRSDASYGHCIEIGEEGALQIVDNRNSGFNFIGDLRDIEVLNKDCILVSKNNGTVEVFKIQLQ